MKTKPEKQEWIVTFRKFYDDNERGGSSSWLVAPNVVETFVKGVLTDAVEKERKRITNEVNAVKKAARISNIEQLKTVIRHEERQRIIGELEGMKNWPEPQKGAGDPIGPLYGAGMYAQYDSDKKKHNQQIDDAIALVKGGE